MKIKHIIWDYNGTLLNDVELCVNVINEMLSDRCKKTITLAQYKEVFDFPVRDYYQKIGFDFDKESFEDIGQLFIDRYNQKINETDLQNFAVDTLYQFSKNNYSQHILSARLENELIIETKFFNIYRYFDNIVGLTHNYATSKIENGIKLIKRLNAEKSEILLIGDTTHDLEVARETGINAIAVSNGHHTAQRLKKCNFPVFDNLKEVVNYLMEK